MFQLNKDSIDTDLPLIISNYMDLLEDELPILYTGTNKFSNRIIGSLINENRAGKFTRYLHSIVDTELYYKFIKGEVSYLNVLKTVKDIYFIDEAFSGEKFVFSAKFSEIPQNHLPTEDSFCPTFQFPISLNYCISLQGKKADIHKAEIADVNDIQTNFKEVFKSVVESLNELQLNARYYLEPAEIGSFRVNFNVEFEEVQAQLFPVDKTKVADYFAKYLDYVITKLPNENVDVLKGSAKNSPALQEIEKKLIELYEEAQIQLPELVIEQNLIDNINETALKFETLTNQITQSVSFDKIELLNYADNGNELGVGLIESDYFDKVKNKLTIEDEDPAVDIVEQDKKPKKYRILVYVLNTENGHGKARLYYDETENFDKISLTINKNEKEINNSTYSNSLHEGKVIDSLGVARKVNGKYKSLKIDL